MISRLLAALIFALLKKFGFRRRVAERNLALMGWLPDRGFFSRLYGAAADDFVDLALANAPAVSVPARTLSRLESMRGGPNLLLTAHFHNWERLGRELKRHGVPLLAAARPMRNTWSEKLLVFFRRRLDVPTVSASVSRAALRHLGGGGCFALLWDQHAPGSGFTGRFFGREVRLNPLPFFLLRHRPCPVFFGVMLPGGILRVISLLSNFDPGWEERLHRRYHRVLEVLVRRFPEYWYGLFHARFKNAAHYPGHRSAGAGQGKHGEVAVVSSTKQVAAGEYGR